MNTGKLQIFGREPTLYISFLNAGVLLLGTFSLHWLTGQQAALAVVAINAIFAAINAYTVRPVSPAIFTYAVGALVALVAAYGYIIPIETVVGINALVIAGLALLTRGQVSPAPTTLSRG